MKGLIQDCDRVASISREIPKEWVPPWCKTRCWEILLFSAWLWFRENPLDRTPAAALPQLRERMWLHHEDCNTKCKFN
ncbi:uncharacterized protein LOC135410240 [Pseudopipra pipra]|uniref:uncharacterized protein LOC135410240 n=1 Tax=Pseudopipra pipra TaxID=415032 RepID=UPI00313A14D3